MRGYDDIGDPQPTDEELLEAEVRRYTRQRIAQRIAREREADALRDAEAPGFTHVDVAALLVGGIVAEVPEVGHRSDELGIFYRRKVNCIWGPPEVGKTLACLEVIRQVLNNGGVAAYVDIDGNGPAAIVGNLMGRGVAAAVVSDPARFRLFTPGTAVELATAVRHVIAMRADIAVIDNNGKVLSLLGLRQNEGDDHGPVMTNVYQPIADSGAALVYIDHTGNDGGEGRTSPIGTAAKNRDFSGVSYFVKKGQQFDRKRGGHSHLLVTKDRPGGIREHLAEADSSGKQYFATYTIDRDGRGEFHAAKSDENTRTARPTTVANRQKTAMTDAEKVREHYPTKPTVRAVCGYLKCGNKRAATAIEEAFG